MRNITMATTLYGALLGLWLVVLSLRVIALRGSPGMGWLKFGYTGEQAVTRSARAQGNLIEYAPMFVILMFIAESGGVSSFSLHYYGGTFLLGRLMHGACMGFMEKSVILRSGGTILTLLPLLGISVLLLMQL
jgi:uncharacterized membrane protein YecN with MAPEG domain